MESSEIELKVNEHYSALAKQVRQKGAASCCGTSDTQIENMGMTGERKPNTAPSFGCNSALIDQAEIKKGEIVIDFGSGPAQDSMDAARRVGSSGKVFGIDFSEEMIALGKENAKNNNLTNMEFILAKITDIPLDDEIADTIISNCVVNLVKDKDKVFDEAYRLLKTGGKAVISDMITVGEVPKYSDELMCACIGGATSIDHYINLLESSGFRNISHSKIYEDEMNYLDVSVPYVSVTFTAYK